MPSIAADTVPEYVTSSPRFVPWLTPDATSTGGSGRSPRTRQVHAVRRRAVHRVLPLRDPIDPERPVQRERVAHRALLAIRRHHVHLAERGQRLGEHREPARVNPVIVGDEDHGRHVD